MTVTPSVSTPVTPGVPGVATGPDAAEVSAESSGLFAQLMAALVPQAGPAAPAPEAQPTEDQTLDAQVAPTPPGLGAQSTDASPLRAPGLPTLPVAGRKATPTVSAAPTDTAVADPPTAAPPMTAVAAVGPATPNPVAGSPRQDSAPTGPTAPTAPTGPIAPTGPTPMSQPQPTPASHGQKPSAGAPHAEAAPVSGLPSPVAPTSAPSGVALTTQATEPAPAGAAAPITVSRQVIPELTRMSTLGEGVHRITMTLRPEALGEVRVTMTVRDGSLHVRLAAGTEAQHALVPDLTQLQQVLKLGSGSDVRVVLRDLAGTPAEALATQDQQSNQAGGQAGQQGTAHHSGHGGDAGATAGSGHQNRREAGTPRDINATDGAVDGTSRSRSQAVRHVRPTGVDLTM